MESSKSNPSDSETALLSLAMDQNGDGVLLIDQEGSIVYANDIFGRVFGLAPENLPGRNALEMLETDVSPLFEDRTGFWNRIESVHRKERDARSTAWTLTGPVPRGVAYSSHLITEGLLKGVRIDLFRDISEQKKVEIAMKASEKRHHALVSSSMVPCCTTSTSFRILSANKAFYDFYHVEKRERESILDIIPPESAAKAKKILKTLTADNPQLQVHNGDDRWIVNGIFTDEETLTEILWVWREDWFKAGERAEKIRCLYSFVHLLHNDEYSEHETLTRGSEMIFESVPWIHALSISIPDRLSVTTGDPEQGIQTLFPVDVGSGQRGEVTIWHEAREQNISAPSFFLLAIVDEITLYLRNKTAQMSAERSQVTYQTLFETTGTASFLLGPEMRICMANREFSQMFGYSEAEIRDDMCWLSCVEDDDQAMVRHFHQARLSDPEHTPRTYECRAYAKDGSPRDVIVNVSLIPGTTLSVISLVDITSKKETEHELRESEHRYRLITENATDVIFTLDADLQFTYVSPSIERLTGIPGARILSRSIADLLTPRSFTTFQDAAIEVSAPFENPEDGSVYSKVFEIETSRKDGTPLWMEVRINPLHDAEEGISDGVMGVMRDISDRKLAEERETQYIRELSFLSSAAMGFVDLPPEDEIYRFIGEHLCSFFDEVLTFVGQYDSLDQKLTVRAVSGVDEDDEPRLYSMARSCMGTGIALPETAYDSLLDGELRAVDHETALSFLPGQVKATAEQYIDGVQGSVHVIGIARSNTLFGCVVLVQRNDTFLEASSTIETFVNLSSVALQRRVLEMELESTKSRLQHILSSSPVMIFSLDPPRAPGSTGLITYVTENITSLLGYEPEEVIYDSTFWTTTIHPSDRRRIQDDEFPELLEKGDKVLEFRMRHKDGKYRWLHFEVRVTRDDDGNPTEVIGSAIDISERKRIEEALRIMDSAITSSINAITITDLEGELIFANNSALKFWGYDEVKKVAGKPLERFWQPKKKVATVLERIGRDGGWMGELVGKKKGGKRFHASVSASMVTDEEGDPLCMMFSFIDITERTEIEEELAKYRTHLEEIVLERTKKLTETNKRLRAEVKVRKEAEEHIRALSTFRESVIENATMLLAVTDSEGRVNVWNRAAEEVTGYARDEVVGGAEIWDTLVPDPVTREKVLKVVRGECTGSDTVENLEFTVQARDGEEKVLHWNARLLRDGGDRLQGVVTLAEDITRRKRMEEEIKASEARYRGVVEDQTEWICRFRPDMKVTFVNEAFCRSFGFSREEVLSSTIDAVLPEWFADFFLSPGEHTDLGQQNFTVEGKVKAKDEEETWHQWTVRAISAPDGAVSEYQVVGRDITLVKKAEEEFIRTEKLLSLSDLAGGIAHDFNNILTSVMGNINLAKMKVSPDDFVYQRLTEAEAATMKAGDITRQLFSFSDLSEPEKETVDIADLVHEAASYALRGSKCKCRFALEPEPMAVMGDAAQVLQVLHALIINADQAMPEGGTVTIGAGPVEVAGNDPIPIPKGRYIRVAVEDHGVGIRPEHMGRIFDPYFTTKKHGSGIGLAMALPIIKNHGGWMDVASEPGQGTTFSLYLPATANGGCEQMTPVAITGGGSGSILLMDDEVGILETTSDILRHLGYTVATAQDGEAAVEAFASAQETGTPFDGVILDLTVPGKMGGLETMEKLKELDPAVRVLVSSGYLNDPIIKNPGKYGFYGSIGKPYLLEELNRILQDLLTH
ncbi:PAS domain S-box-containing protein [Methanofollis sp. W23]|uniref:PAS domain S-box protein n=1 Tax=Methanofollis sp. W23 TaxID=2817849 RepID=UPI001AE962F8|nr:PAS domain S-box protein [Methanofollis sp. W23]MBP2145785.1 PAS domain S-box-containing protein [Methanofollis sp. W23]